MSQRDDEKDELRAARLGRLIDDALAGEAPPALLDVEERALLETATEIHGTIHARLPTGRRRALVDAAFAEMDGAVPVAAPEPPRRRANLAWALCAALAVAAVAALVIPRGGPAPTADEISRSDRLVGPISADAVDDARARLDAIYADRLALRRGALLAGRTP